MTSPARTRAAARLPRFVRGRPWWIGLLAVVLVLAGATPATAADTAGPATTTLKVQPVLVLGNVNCADRFPGSAEIRVQPVTSGTYGSGGNSVTIKVGSGKSGQFFDFSQLTGNLVGISVKGGNNTNVYDYSGRFPTADTFLHAPLNSKNRSFYGLSHVSFCFGSTPPPVKSPNSELHKAVRNVTAGQAFGTDPGTPAGTTAKPGDTIEFRLVHHNHGDATATGVVVKDVLPAHSTLASCSPACGVPVGATSGTLTWTLGSVAPGTSTTLLFRVTLDKAFAPGSTNVDNVGVTDSDQETPENSNKVTVTVTAVLDSELHKAVRNVTAGQPFGTDPSSPSTTTAKPGQVIEYRLTHHNHGDTTATGVVVTDALPDRTTLASCTPACGLSPGATSGTLSWSLGDVSPGEVTTLVFRVTLDKAFPAGTTSVDNVGVTDSDQETPESSNKVTVSISAVATMDVEKTASAAQPKIGDKVTYTITITNTGDAPGSTGASDAYDAAHLDVDNATITGGGTDDDKGTITWPSASIAPGAVVTYTYTGTVKGTFTGASGSNGCATGQYAVLNTVTVAGDTDTARLCVPAAPKFDVTKAASADTAKIGDTVTYTIMVKNLGDASGSTVPKDDYDQAHLAVAPGTISGGGTDNGDSITWPSVSLAPGATATYTYTGTIKGTFAGTSGTGGCEPGTYPVLNKVVVTGDEATETVCVLAAPRLEVDKTSASTDLRAGDLVTYTLAYGNSGDAAAGNAVVTDTLDSATAFSSCTGPTGAAGGCTAPVTPTGGTVTWQLGSLPAKATGKVTVTVKVLDTVGCQVCDTASLAADNGTTATDTLCLTGNPSPRPAGAHANGSAFGLDVTVRTLLGLVTVDTGPFPDAASSVSGPGTDSDADTLLSVAVAGVASANVEKVTTTSTVTAQPAQARQTSVARVADVNLVNGLVTADLVQAVASTSARGDGAGFSSAGTTFAGLVVAGQLLVDVAPNTKIALDPLAFGAGSYVALREEVGTVAEPPAGQLSGGTYASDLAVSMIRVHITGGLLASSVDITLSSATAHSDFPQTTLCTGTARLSVSGHAFIASATIDPPLVQPVVGFVDIPASGGAQHAALNTTSLGTNGSLATTGTAASDSTGTTGPTGSSAASYAQADDICLLTGASGCAVAARAVVSQASSSAGSGGATSNDGSTTLVGLRVLGVPLNIDPPPNTKVLDLNLDSDPDAEALLILNEQFCDGLATLASGCADATHSGITVRAARVVLLDPAAGALPGAEVIVAEAHADAGFVPAP